MLGMRILVLGGDGYLGWPAALHLSALGLKPTLLSATLILAQT